MYTMAAYLKRLVQLQIEVLSTFKTDRYHMMLLLLIYICPGLQIYESVPYWAVQSAKAASCSRLTEGRMDRSATSKSPTSMGRMLSAGTQLTAGPRSLQ